MIKSIKKELIRLNENELI